MTTATKVTRLIPSKDVVTHFKTLKTASEEADDYTFQRAGNGHTICKHGENAYAIIEKMSLDPVPVPVIGCSCYAWTHAHGQDGCKHVATLLKRSRRPAAALSSRIKLDLLAAGWRETKDGNVYPPSEEKLTEDAAERQEEIDAAMDAKWNKKHPEAATSDPDGEDNEGSDPLPPEKDKPAPELGDKVWTRKCPHCDQLFEGMDLDEVKREHQDHIEMCQAKPEPSAEVAPKPEPAPKVKPASRMITTKCQWCGDVLQHEDPAGLQALIKEHEAICPKRPAEPEDAVQNDLPRDQAKIVAIGDNRLVAVDDSGEIIRDSATVAENTTVEPQPEEESKMAEEETKTYAHPDGAEFDTAEELLDYEDTLKEAQNAETMQQRAEFELAPMIKGIAPRMRERGRITIGKKGAQNASGRGRKTIKFDHFVFTTVEKDEKTDDYVLDSEMNTMYGDNCREIPVRFLSDDITDIFATFYAKYTASGIKLRGDGENWIVYNSDGTRDYIHDPTGERGFLNDPDVKPHGILTVLVDGQDSVGSVYRFRTTGWNSINGMLSSLALCAKIAQRAGGRIAFLPMMLVYSSKWVTPAGQATKKKIPVVTCEFRGSIEELQERSREAMQYLSAPGSDDLVQLAESNVYDPEDESVEAQQDIAAEFSPGVA